MADMINLHEKIKIEQHILYVDDNILYIISNGDTDEEAAIRIKEAILEFFKARNKTSIFVDMNNFGKITPEARRKAKEVMNHEKTGNIAFVGNHPVARVIAEFLILVSGNKKSRFFGNPEEALNWLKTNS
jgi:hypothetical protein